MSSDYIIRMIEQFARVLAAIVTSRKAGDHEKIFEQLQVAGRAFLDVDIFDLLRDTPEKLVGRFKFEDRVLNTEKCVICADLIYEIALIADLESHPVTAQRLKVLCLNLYLAAILQDHYFQKFQYYQHVEGLLKDLLGYPLPRVVQDNLNAYKILRQTPKNCP